MKVEEAKRIIREQPSGNVAERLEAIRIAVLILGDDADEDMIMEWAEHGPEVDMGELIDRDALRTEVMDSDLDHLQRDDWKEIIQIVNDAPTVVQAERSENDRLHQQTGRARITRQVNESESYAQMATQITFCLG